MDVTRFGLGVRFDALGTMPDDGVAKQFLRKFFRAYCYRCEGFACVRRSLR